MFLKDICKQLFGIVSYFQGIKILCQGCMLRVYHDLFISVQFSYAIVDLTFDKIDGETLHWLGGKYFQTLNLSSLAMKLFIIGTTQVIMITLRLTL